MAQKTKCKPAFSFVLCYEPFPRSHWMSLRMLVLRPQYVGFGPWSGILTVSRFNQPLPTCHSRSKLWLARDTQQRVGRSYSFKNAQGNGYNYYSRVFSRTSFKVPDNFAA
jgi:hypothetical protein